jgi:hypothetical protein
MVGWVNDARKFTCMRCTRQFVTFATYASMASGRYGKNTFEWFCVHEINVDAHLVGPAGVLTLVLLAGMKV